MAHSIDPEPLKAFFEEVLELFDIKIEYLPNNIHYPIQLVDPENGLSRTKCLDLFQYIKGQTDLKDNEIGKIHASKKQGRFVIEVSSTAAAALADVYALSFFYPHEDELQIETDKNINQPKPADHTKTKPSKGKD